MFVDFLLLFLFCWKNEKVRKYLRNLMLNSANRKITLVPDRSSKKELDYLLSEISFTYLIKRHLIC